MLLLKQSGFCVEAEMAPEIRGLVDLVDGVKHLQQCLTVASEEEIGVIHFEFKLRTANTTIALKDFIKKKAW